MTIITSTQAAERLGISKRRVNKLIQEKRLPAQPFGKAWMIEEADLVLVADRKNGRPSRTHATAP